MYAIIRQNNYSLTKLPNTGVLDEKIQRLHGSQPEYSGSPGVGTGEGIQIVVNVLDSEEHADAGRGAIVNRYGNLRSSPSRRLLNL